MPPAIAVIVSAGVDHAEHVVVAVADERK